MRQRLPAKSWAQFERRIRRHADKLIGGLSDYPDCILVAGCQRSGTTAVARLLRAAVGSPEFGLTNDDELDAALILNGAIRVDPSKRIVFQSTFVNAHFREYFEHDNFRLVWIVRQPEAVVRSMLKNWRYSALVRLFNACGKAGLSAAKARRYERFGALGISRLEMACLSYNAKTMQIHELASILDQDRLLIIDYDELLADKVRILPRMFEFVSVPYDDCYADSLRQTKLRAGAGLSRAHRQRITEVCNQEYQNVLALMEQRSKASAELPR